MPQIWLFCSPVNIQNNRWWATTTMVKPWCIVLCCPSVQPWRVISVNREAKAWRPVSCWLSLSVNVTVNALNALNSLLLKEMWGFEAQLSTNYPQKKAKGHKKVSHHRRVLKLHLLTGCTFFFLPSPGWFPQSESFSQSKICINLFS